MSTPVEQIKERLGIAEVVGAYLKLERAGSSLKAKCPFHNERTPSFFVSPARGSYYCFGCGAKGDIFSFVQEFEGLDFVGALRVLASRAGITLTKVDPKVRSQHARSFLLLEKATRFFERMLAENEEAKTYLASRGLLPATSASWRVGFAPNEWRALFEALLTEGFKPDEMEQVGLVKKARAEDGSPKENKFYDTFRGRVIFPIADSAGRIIAFSGRILPAFDDGKTGKYINSPETPLFNKSEVLYGFDRAKLAIRQKDAAILVEGQMDLLMAHQAGDDNTVASSGTALGDHQLTRLKRLSENLLLSFDSDSAGLRASERAIRLALSLGMNVKVIALQQKDPAELIQHDPKAWKEAVKNARQVIDFLLDTLLTSQKAGRERALAIERSILPLVRLLPSVVEQSHFLKVIAERSGLREEALFASLQKLPLVKTAAVGAVATGASPRAQKEESRRRTISRRIFALLFLSEERKLTDEAEKISQKLTEILGEKVMQKAREVFTKERDTLLSEAEFVSPEGAPPDSELSALFHHLEEEQLSTQLQELMDKLAASTQAKNESESQTLLREAHALTARLAALKSERFANP